MGVAECTTVKITREAVARASKFEEPFRRLATARGLRAGLPPPPKFRVELQSTAALPFGALTRIDPCQVWKGEYADFTLWQLHSVRHVDVDDPDLVVRATSPGRGARKASFTSARRREGDPLQECEACSAISAD